MKLKDTEKAALIVLLGIAIAALSIIYIAKPKFEERQAIETECVQLQARLAELQAKEADREKYEAGIVEYTQKYENVLNAFPADLNQEITIMFLEGVKDSNDFFISSLGLGEKSEFYTLGSMGGDGAIDTSVPTDAAAPADAAATDAALTEEPAVAEDALTCYSANFPIAYTGSYKSLKDVVTYIDNFSDRMTVDSLDIAFSGDGLYSGSLELSCYSVEGESRPERSIDINQVEIGVDNIFEGTGAANGSDVTLNKYDEKEGNNIKTDYDFYVMLNPATSDVSAKVVGQNGSGKEATVLSNNDNAISAITYDFYEVDGKMYCKYTLNSSLSYEAEVTSAEDVKIFIQSSARKNEDDKVAAKITVTNTTSFPVYVKVSEDDAASPRVTVSKMGAVKVYQ